MVNLVKKRKFDDTIAAVNDQMIRCDGVQLDNGSSYRTPAYRLWYHSTCMVNLGMEPDGIARDRITCPLCGDYSNDLTKARRQLTSII